MMMISDGSGGMLVGVGRDGGARTNLSSYTKALTENLLTPDQSLLKLKIKMDNVLLDCDANAEVTFGNSEDIVATIRFIEKNCLIGLWSAYRFLDLSKLASHNSACLVSSIS